MTVEKIITVLDELIQVHQTFIEIGQQKTDTLKRNDISNLDKLVQKEDILTKRVQQLENKRQQAIFDYLQEHYYLPEDVTLEELIQIVPVTYRDALKERQLKLVNEVIALKDINDLNRQLLQQSLQLVNISMKLLNPQPSVKNYERPDRSNPTSPGEIKSRFDSKA